MNFRIVSAVIRVSLALSLGTLASIASAQGLAFPVFEQHEAMFDFVGQVKNLPPAGPGLPATSNQYGYLSHIQGLEHAYIHIPDP